METKFYVDYRITLNENNHLYFHYYIVGAPTKEDACKFLFQALNDDIDEWHVKEITLEEIEELEVDGEDCVTWL